MVKRKMKKAVKQKQKQNVNVKQNVKVVVGEIKKKRAVKSSGAKAGAKPPMVLNISNPQPYNNMFMEYFKKQLQNQEPVKANTLSQQEKINEQQETKASKAGALHSLDREPNDVARELRRQRVAGIERFQQAEADRKSEQREMVSSIRRLPKETKSASKPLPPQKTPLNIFPPSPQPSSDENAMMSALDTQQSEMEQAITQGVEEMKDDSSSSELLATPVKSYQAPANPIREIVKKPSSARRRGRKLTEEEIQQKLREQENERREKIRMGKEDPLPRRGPRLLTPEELARRKLERENRKRYGGRNTEDEN